MTETNWREGWSQFRLAVVDETAKCVTNKLAADAGGELAYWEALSPAERVEITEHVAFILLAESQAMANLVDRGEVL